MTVWSYQNGLKLRTSIHGNNERTTNYRFVKRWRRCPAWAWSAARSCTFCVQSDKPPTHRRRRPHLKSQSTKNPLKRQIRQRRWHQAQQSESHRVHRRSSWTTYSSGSIFRGHGGDHSQGVSSRSITCACAAASTWAQHKIQDTVMPSCFSGEAAIHAHIMDIL